MATTTNNTIPDYTSLGAIKNYWLETIAPNYFDFTNVENYNVGIFGYANEVMGNTTEDTFNAVAISRREFYPVTAEFTSSLYAMATLQSVPIPLTKPSMARAILIIPQDEIIDNSVYDESDGLYKMTIDNCLKIFAGDLQFMLDYPINIISRRTDKWIHTSHYDVSTKNSLANTTATRYISNKVIKENGQNYVAFFLDVIRQVQMEEISNTVVKDTILDTVTMDIDFSGDLANFEVFYKENSNSDELQLSKVMINAKTPSTPYVKYELINKNKIRLTFTYNTIWYPKFNSEIICRIYTSEGSDGNFNMFKEDLVCSSDSEKYPYNSNLTILGRISGSAYGGSDQLLDEEFRNKVLKAYATNETISTENDLQFFFDDLSDDISGVKVLFKKKRDDCFNRLFGAYSVYKDEAENVIPSNTLELEINRGDIVEDLIDNTPRMTIPSGMVFKYKSSDSFILVPALNDDGTKMTLLDVVKKEDSDNTMYFTNPFAISINVYPNNCGYYMTSLNETRAIEYTYVEDSSSQQFIGSSLSIFRNSMTGSNYYRFRIMITPASEMNQEYCAIINDPDDEGNSFKATKAGKVTKEEYYYDEEIGQGYVRFILTYNDGTIEYIQGSNTLPINHTSVTGWEMKLQVGDSFRVGDTIATKRCDDLGNLIIAADISGQLLANDLYMPFSIQGYSEELNAFIMEAYISTDDAVDSNEKAAFNHGIFRNTGSEQTSALNVKDHHLEMNVLFINEDNNVPDAKYGLFTGLENYTLTNTYVSNEQEPFDLLTPLSYIRSNLDFYPLNPEDPSDNDDYQIVIDEVPVLGASWTADPGHFTEFVSQYMKVIDITERADMTLNNTFSIDTKFYNTYGKARFFTVGNNVDDMVSLDSVRCSFHFGVSLTTISSTDAFISKFRSFVQSYIEADSRVTTEGQDLFILNLIGALREEFEEIRYIEYYGFNSYDYRAQKIIGPDLTSFNENFIPEFLNLNIVKDLNGTDIPEVIVDILE